MGAKRLRDVAVGRRELDQERECLGNGETGAARVDREPKRAETCLLERGDLRERQRAIEFSPDRTSANAVDDGSKPGDRLLIATAARGGPGRGSVVHDVLEACDAPPYHVRRRGEVNSTAVSST